MDVLTQIYHLRQDELYSSEKPYTMRYAPNGRMMPTNVVREKRTVKVRDLRGREDHFDLDRDGFVVKTLKSKMTYEDYDDSENITKTYLQELEGVLDELFPGSYVDFISYLVRTSDFGKDNLVTQNARSENATVASRMPVASHISLDNPT